MYFEYVPTMMNIDSTLYFGRYCVTYSMIYRYENVPI